MSTDLFKISNWANDLFFIYVFNICSLIWLHWVLVAASGVFLLFFFYLPLAGSLVLAWDLVPDQGLNPGPMHWECRVLATGPSGKSPSVIFDVTIVIVLGVPQTAPVYKTVSLTDKCCVCSDCSVNQPVLRLSPSSWASLFPKTQKYWN